MTQFKLDTCMQVTQVISRDTWQQQVSNVCTTHIKCCIAPNQQHAYSFSTHASIPLNTARAQYVKYESPNCSNHGQRTYVMQPHQLTIKSQRWHLFHYYSECVCGMCSEQLCYFRTVVTRITFGLLAVVAFLESSNILQLIEYKVIINGDNPLSRLHTLHHHVETVD